MAIIQTRLPPGCEQSHHHHHRHRATAASAALGNQYEETSNTQEQEGAATSACASSSSSSAPPKAILKWVKKTINAVDLGAWEMNLDAQVLSADAALVSRQHRRSSRDIGSASDVTSYHSNGSKKSSNSQHIHGNDNATHGRSSSTTPTTSPSSPARQTQMSTSPPLFLDSISLVTLTPVAAAFTAPNSPHYMHSTSSQSKKASAAGALGGNRRPSTASVLTADKGSCDSSAPLVDSSPQAMRKAQIRRFIASVNRPQSIDLGSDHEAEMAGEGAGDTMRANGSRFLLGSVGRARGAAAKQAGLDLHTPLVALPPLLDEHSKPTAGATATSKSNSANSAQYATAAMLAMS